LDCALFGCLRGMCKARTFRGNKAGEQGISLISFAEDGASLTRWQTLQCMRHSEQHTLRTFSV